MLFSFRLRRWHCGIAAVQGYILSQQSLLQLGEELQTQLLPAGLCLHTLQLCKPRFADTLLLVL